MARGRFRFRPRPGGDDHDPGDEARGRAGIVFGIPLLLFGVFVSYAGYHDYGFAGPFFPGLGVVAGGLFILIGGLLFPTVDILRLFGGIVTTLLGLACIGGGLYIAATASWKGLGLIPFGLLWLVGACLCFDLTTWLARHGYGSDDQLSKILGGTAAMLAAFIITGLVGADPSRVAAGVMPVQALAGGAVFVAVGLLILLSGTNMLARDGLERRLLVAIFLTLFAVVAMVFPPGGVVVAYLAVNGWIAAYRSLEERRTGRDPLAGRSQEQVLGIGCLASAILAGVAALVWWLGQAAR